MQRTNILRKAFSTSRQANSSQINASILLSRIPIVTRDVSEFDEAFYNYQEELERRLMWTFPKWYYFKKGTVAEREFTQAQKYPVPNHPGVWFPEGRPDIKHGRDRRFKEEVILPKKHAEGDEIDLEDVSRPIKPNSRLTKADETNDQSSLERKLSRTLYLVTKCASNNEWKLPTFKVETIEKGLHQVAEDGLRTIGGDKINTWSVSNTPAAVIKYDSNNKLINETEDNANSKEYIVKSHIVAGKFDLQKDINEVSDFKWLVKEEIESLLKKEYYDQISPLLSEY